MTPSFIARRVLLITVALMPIAATAQTAAPPPMQMPEHSGAPMPAGPVVRTPAPPDASVYIISPRDGARLHSPVTVRFGLRNMGVTQAGSAAANAGHHHLLIDVTQRLDPNEPIPADKNHLHFGGGQTETVIDLPPGRHTLQLVLGDKDHRLFIPSLESPMIHIRVRR
jgi:hypothetical protein